MIEELTDYGRAVKVLLQIAEGPYDPEIRIDAAAALIHALTSVKS